MTNVYGFYIGKYLKHICTIQKRLFIVSIGLVHVKTFRHINYDILNDETLGSP